MIQKAVEGDTVCGKGPVVTYGPAVHNTVRELLIDTAAKQKIPIQRDAASRSTGTDTDAFAYANGGVPSALVSLPLRYMHTTVEMAQISDVDQVIKLLYHTLRRLSPTMSLTYL
jgi:putative aminopeptidase FrvX